MENTNLISLINEKYPKLSKGHKQIAAFVVDRYDKAVFMTAAQIGESVGVSESTVVRFATALGFDGFPEFMSSLEDWYKDKMNSVQKIGAKYGKSSQSELINTVMNSDMENIKNTIENLDVKSFEIAVDTILKARRIYIVGLRSCKPLAQFLQFYLNMIRPDVILLDSTSSSELFEQMIRIDENDCLIGISFPRYSLRTLKVMEFAHDRNASIIAITDSLRSPMALYSTLNLVAKSDMVSIVDSLVAPLSVINTLVVALCLKLPDKIKKNLEELEDVWSNYQIYIKDEIEFVRDEPVLNYSLKNTQDEDTE